MDKENTITIGYYHIPGESWVNMYVEDTKTYKRDKFKVNVDEFELALNKLKEMYPKNQVCEFVY